MSRTCECCGQPLPNKLGYYLDGRYAVKDGKRTRLSPQEHALLEAVTDAYPRPAHLEYVIERLWPDCDEPENTVRALGVLAFNIRNKTGIPLFSDTGAYVISDHDRRRNTQPRRFVTPEERARAQELYDKGHTWIDIEAMLGRSRETLRHHVTTA